MADRELSPPLELSDPPRLHRADECSPRLTRAASKGASHKETSKRHQSKEDYAALEKDAKRHLGSMLLKA